MTEHPTHSVIREKLIAELRYHQEHYPSMIHAELCGRAADDIERLRAQLAALREELGRHG